CSSQALAVW
nr:immunoglobulin heavy chain junction region [Macaca mulatta]MOY18816.1 immunoglobulin heavy chain junction region [Macaca mulatta]MOY19913.1 immunoglobulin heavy chain junction region [Macaca mulatta]MOY20975.1 immunoglobulin heavy chain junction region [Macaca mulatta]